MMLFVVFAIGLLAGFVDAIAGGGGLIMLPGLLFSGLPVGGAIATNKLCGTCGAITSTLKFAQAKQIDWRACQLMALPIIIGAYLGSSSIGLLPAAWAEPTVVVLMILITLFVLFKPSFGSENRRENNQIKSKTENNFSSASLSSGHSSSERSSSEALSSKNLLSGNSAINRFLLHYPLKTIMGLILCGVAIGFHDGFFGPGTGIFLVFSLLTLLPIDFLKATGSTKFLNLLANVTALMTFALSGNIDYSKGIFGAAGVILGSFMGATFATKKGVKLIKPVFIVVTIALVIKLLAS